MRNFLKPNIQLFADEPPATPTPSTIPDATPAPATDPEAIATALMTAIESRQRRSENVVAKSFAEQYGMSEEEVTSLLEGEKQKRASAPSPEVLKQIERANNLLISAEIKSLGASMGLVDSDVAMALIDKGSIKVGDDGSITGAKEALESLKQTKAFLFQQPQPQAWGARMTGSPEAMTGVEAAFKKLNPDLKIE